MRVNKKKIKKDYPMTLAPKFQFGGFPSLFDTDFSNYDEVSNKLKNNPTVGNTFQQAFEQDNPDLIASRFLQDLSLGIQTNQNPLLTADDPSFNGATLDQAAEDTAKRRTFLGIGKGRSKRKATEQLQGVLDEKNNQITQFNQAVAPTQLPGIVGGTQQANMLFDLLSNFQLQQGGNPFDIVPRSGGIDNTYGVTDHNITTRGYVGDSKQSPIKYEGDMLDAINDGLSIPQDLVTFFLTGKYQDPSEALGVSNPIAAATTDIVLDPLNLVTLGGWAELKALAKASGGAKAANKVKKAEILLRSIPAVGELREEANKKKFQQGGSPISTNRGITYDELEQQLEDDTKFIKGLKDNEEGRGYISGLLADMGFETGQDEIKKYKELQRLNISPKKGATNDIDSGLLDYLAGNYRDFQLKSWGFHPQELQQGGMAQLGYSVGSPYQNMSSIPIPGNNITMANTARELLAIPNVGQPKLMQPYSGTHIFPGASQVVEKPIMQQGGLINTDILTEKGDPWEYQKVNGAWKTRKKGAKNWITAKDLPLAAIKNRYEPSTLTPTEVKTVEKFYKGEGKKVPVPGTAIVAQGVPLTNSPVGNSFQGRQFTVRDIPQGNDVPVMSTDQRSISVQEPTINQVNLPNTPTYGYGVTDQFGNETAGSPDYQAAMMASILYPNLIGIPAGNAFIHPAEAAAVNWVTRAGSKAAKVASTANKYNKMFREGGKPKRRLYQEGGLGAVGAQLEVGELFASANADIFDTAATEKHKDMKKDKVTDVLAEGDYVFSDLDRMKITRKEAEDLSFGLGGVLYKEGDIPTMPVEMTAADLLKEGEDEAKLTEYVDRIRKKYVIKDSDDVFDKKTNDFNRQSRGMYLSAAAVINEKRKKGDKSAGYASTFGNPFETAITATANPDNSTTSDARAATPEMNPNEFQQGGVPHYQPGGGLNPLSLAMNAIPFVGGIIQGFGALGSARNNRRDIGNALLKDRRDINQVAGSQSQYQGLSTAAALAGLAAQNPYVESPQYDTTQLDASIRRVPKSLFDYQASRLAAASKPYMDQAFNNSGSFQQGVNAYAPVAAANASSMAQLGMNEVNQNIALENQYRAQKQGYADRQVMGDVAAQNATRDNTNQLLAGAGSTLSGGIASQGNIESNRLNSLRNNNFQQVANTVNWRQAKNDAWSKIIGNTASGVQSMNNMGVFNQSGENPITPQTVSPTIMSPENHMGYIPPMGMPAIPKGLNSSPFYYQQPGGGYLSWDPASSKWSNYSPDNSNGPGLPQGYFDPITGTFHYRQGGRFRR